VYGGGLRPRVLGAAQESCALTQNFVSEVGLPATLAFLKSRSPELVSGCATENRFVTRWQDPARACPYFLPYNALRGGLWYGGSG
jgi:hypothetical protein